MSLTFYSCLVRIKLITTFSMIFLVLALLESPPCTYLCNKQTANGKFKLRPFTVLYFSVDFRDLYASAELPPSWFVKASATWEECPPGCARHYRHRWGGPSHAPNIRVCMGIFRIGFTGTNTGKFLINDIRCF